MSKAVVYVVGIKVKIKSERSGDIYRPGKRNIGIYCYQYMHVLSCVKRKMVHKGKRGLELAMSLGKNMW